MTIQATAARLRRWVAIEEATFAMLGGWVPSVELPAAKLLLAEHARHHGWHAQLWRERVPAIPDVEARPSPELDAFFARLALVATVEERLTVAYLVLGRVMVAEYRSALATASSASDGPMIRGLLLVLADAERDLAAGQDLLGDVEPTRGIVALRVELEALWPPSREG